MARPRPRRDSGQRRGRPALRGRVLPSRPLRGRGGRGHAAARVPRLARGRSRRAGRIRCHLADWILVPAGDAAPSCPRREPAVTRHCAVYLAQEPFGADAMQAAKDAYRLYLTPSAFAHDWRVHPETHASPMTAMGFVLAVVAFSYALHRIVDRRPRAAEDQFWPTQRAESTRQRRRRRSSSRQSSGSV
jgi:hypothetical protein